MDDLTRNEPPKRGCRRIAPGGAQRNPGVEKAKRVGTLEEGDGNSHPCPSPRCGGSSSTDPIFPRVPLRSTRSYIPPSLQDLNYLVVESFPIPNEVTKCVSVFKATESYGMETNERFGFDEMRLWFC